MLPGAWREVLEASAPARMPPSPGFAALRHAADLGLHLRAVQVARGGEKSALVPGCSRNSVNIP